MTENTATITDKWPTDPLGWLLAYCSKRVRDALVQRFAAAGYRISAEQWSIMAQLWQADGLSQQVLANRFHRSKVAAFHLISKLEQQGVVVRRPNPDDGRSNLIYLTPTGRTMVEELVPLAQGVLDKAAMGIASGELDIARRVLYQIAHNMTE